MSWLTDLAGKAENLLNSIDESAAQALNSPSDSAGYNYKRIKEPYIEKDTCVHQLTNFVELEHTGILKSNTRSDTDLFKFNSQSALHKHGRSSDTNSDKASSGYRTNPDDFDTYNLTKNYDNGDMDSNGAQLENKLLRSEISSLNQEISSLLQRSHKTEEECKKLRNQNEKMVRELRETDRKVRQLLSEKDDLEETIKAKESQIEAIQTEMKSMKDKYLENSADVELTIVTEHRNKIAALEAELLNRTELLEKTEADKMQLQGKLEDVKMRLAQTINDHTKAKSEDKRRIELLINQLEMAKSKTEGLQQEMTEYKAKATKILQMKEKVINELKNADVGTEGSNGHTVDDDGGVARELLDLREESARLREDAERCRVELEHKEFDLQELEQQLHAETESLRRNSDLLEQQLERERQMREDTELDYRQLTKEKRSAEEKFVRERAELQDILIAKEQELISAKANQHQQNKNWDGSESGSLSSPHLMSSNTTQLQQRIESLTESLLQRQIALEASRSECHSLQLQLEQRNKPYSITDKRVLGYTNGQYQQQYQDYVSIDLTDSSASRGCKVAVNSVDRMGLRLAVMFRNYPPARIFMVCYMILIHIWLLFVFFTYQPEIHSTALGNSPVVPSLPNNHK